MVNAFRRLEKVVFITLLFCWKWRVYIVSLIIKIWGIQIYAQTTLYVKFEKMIRISIGPLKNNWKKDFTSS